MTDNGNFQATYGYVKHKVESLTERTKKADKELIDTQIRKLFAEYPDHETEINELFFLFEETAGINEDFILNINEHTEENKKDFGELVKQITSKTYAITVLHTLKEIKQSDIPEKDKIQLEQDIYLYAERTKKELEYERTKSRIELKKTIKQTEDSTKKDTEIFPVCQFPHEAIPERLRKLCQEISEVYQVDVRAVYSIMFAILSGCIGNSVNVYVNNTWKQSPFLWFVIIGQTGMGKSDIQAFLMSYIKSIQNEKYREYKERLKEYNKAKKEYDRDKNGSVSEPEKPELEHLFTTDTTVEKLYSIFEHSPRGIIADIDEYSSLVRGLNQYKKVGNDREHYQKIWNSQPDKIDRKTGTVYCKKTGMSIVSGTQPKEILQLFSDNFYDSGFVPRFLFLQLKNIKKQYTEVDIQDKAVWIELVKYAYDLACFNSDNDIIPHKVYFSTEAKEVFRQYYNYLEELRPFLSSKAQSFISKIEKYFSRFAGILHVIDCYFTGKDISDHVSHVSREIAEHSKQLCEFFLSQGVILIELSKEEEPSEYEKRIIQVLFELQSEVKNGRLQIGTITEAYNKSIPKKVQLSARKTGDVLRRNLKLKTEEKGGLKYLLWDEERIKKLFSQQRHEQHGQHNYKDKTMKKEEIFNMT